MNPSRLRYHPDSQLILYQPKAGHDVDEQARLDPLESCGGQPYEEAPQHLIPSKAPVCGRFLARVLIHIPEPNEHLVHFYGAYANRFRQTFRDPIRLEEQAKPTPTRTAKKRWRALIYRIFEVAPLTCDRCGGEMKILAFITEQEVIGTILDHRYKIAACGFRKFWHHLFRKF